MNEQILAGCYQDMCETLLAIQKDGLWRERYPTFEAYCRKRWSLGKGQAKRMVLFAKFLQMAREHKMRLPETPESVAPIFDYPQYDWLNLWQRCIDCEAFTADAMKQIGVSKSKSLPEHVRRQQKLKRAVARIAEQEDGEKVIDEFGPRAGGPQFGKAVQVMIDMDQAARSER